MNCEQIRDQLIETARGRELSSDLRAIVFAHAAGCGDCALRLDREQQLTGMLAELAVRTDGAPESVEQLLRRKLTVTPIRQPKPAPFVWASIGAVAAGVVLGALLLRPGSVVPKARTNPVRVTPVTSAARIEPPMQAPQSVGGSMTHHVAAPQAQAAAHEDDASAFILLPYAEELGPTEQTETLRVELRRESLLAMGLPVSADDLNEPIQADILVGMDGTPRAIRIAN